MGLDWPIVAARFFTYGLAIVLFGRAAYAANLRTPPGRGWFSVAAPAALALSALVYLVLLAREAAARPGLPPPGVVAQLAVLVGFGRALVVAIVAAVALAVVTWLRPNAQGARLALGGLALASLAFVGHAADGRGPAGLLRLATMAGHLLAVGTWLGALAPLLAAILSDPPDGADTLKRFGTMAVVAVFTVLGTGLCSLAFVVADVRGAVGPGYLKTLGVKLCFVLGLLTVAAANRWWLTPLAEREPERAVQRLRISIVVEQLLGMAAVASVAVLGQLDPTM